MTRPEMSRLVRKLFTLGMLVACLCLFTFVSAEKRVAAAACCSSCDPAYESCVASCGDPAPSACLFFCERRYQRCLSTCDPNCLAK